MIEDNPLMSELERMIAFCKAHEHIYIYRTDELQKLISKYFAMSQIRIEGFIKPEVFEGDRAIEPFPIYNFYEMKLNVEKYSAENVGVIISNQDEVYNQIIDTLKMTGVDDFFIVGAWNKHAIHKKMKSRTAEEFLLEVNLADHCNLNCQCCDHFSPLAPKTFLDFDQYVKDIKRLSKLTGGKIGLMKLQGGEPLLNDRLIDYIAVTREAFPDSYVCIFTDGLLLNKWGGGDIS